MRMEAKWEVRWKNEVDIIERARILDYSFFDFLSILKYENYNNTGDSAERSALFPPVFPTEQKSYNMVNLKTLPHSNPSMA